MGLLKRDDAPAVPAEPEWTGQRWEYQVLHGAAIRNPDKLAARLTDLGARGWEVVGIGGDFGTVVLKRPAA